MLEEYNKILREKKMIAAGFRGRDEKEKLNIYVVATVRAKEKKKF